jgi:hypothetical protein
LRFGFDHAHHAADIQRHQWESSMGITMPPSPLPPRRLAAEDEESRVKFEE